MLGIFNFCLAGILLFPIICGNILLIIISHFQRILKYYYELPLHEVSGLKEIAILNMDKRIFENIVTDEQIICVEPHKRSIEKIWSTSSVFMAFLNESST